MSHFLQRLRRLAGQAKISRVTGLMPLRRGSSHMIASALRQICQSLSHGAAFCCFRTGELYL